MKTFEAIDYLRLVAFVLTIVIVSYGTIKGLDTIELYINMIYFIILIVILAYDNIRILFKGD